MNDNDRPRGSGRSDGGNRRAKTLLDTADIGHPITDDEVRALGYEPTPRGWVPLHPEPADHGEPAPSDKSDERPELIPGLRDVLARRRLP